MPVEMKIEIEEGGEKLTVTDGTNKAFAYGDAEPQPARTDPTESLSRSLSKTGGTPFSAEKSTWRWMAAPGLCRAVPSTSCAVRHWTLC